MAYARGQLYSEGEPQMWAKHQESEPGSGTGKGETLLPCVPGVCPQEPRGRVGAWEAESSKPAERKSRSLEEARRPLGARAFLRREEE